MAALSRHQDLTCSWSSHAHILCEWELHAHVCVGPCTRRITLSAKCRFLRQPGILVDMKILRKKWKEKYNDFSFFSGVLHIFCKLY